jgi:uncharacterized membrane protein YgdD (TMEM256/DUF423 family)
MRKKVWAFGCASMAMAVMLGALGAHALQQKVTDGVITSQQLDSFQTGVRYQVYHALALLILGLITKHINHKLLPLTAIFFVAGTLLFSGSIYLLATRQILHIESWTSILGPITPIGGILLSAGWIMFLVAVLKTKFNEPEVREI